MQEGPDEIPAPSVPRSSAVPFDASEARELSLFSFMDGTNKTNGEVDFRPVQVPANSTDLEFLEQVNANPKGLSARVPVDTSTSVTQTPENDLKPDKKIPVSVVKDSIKPKV